MKLVLDCRDVVTFHLLCHVDGSTVVPGTDTLLLDVERAVLTASTVLAAYSVQVGKAAVVVILFSRNHQIH